MTHSDFMSEALILAKSAEKHGDVPVGAVIVKNGEIIAKTIKTTENLWEWYRKQYPI